MLTILDRGYARDCSGPTRREFLGVGNLGLAGLSLPELLAAWVRAGSVNSAGHQSVVLLFVLGGPTRLETWDPKPGGPADDANLHRGPPVRDRHALSVRRRAAPAADDVHPAVRTAIENTPVIEELF